MSSEALDSPSNLQTKLLIGRIGVAICAYSIVYVLKRIELNTAIVQRRKPRFDLSSVGKDTTFQVSISPTPSNVHDDDDDDDNHHHNDKYINLKSSNTMTTLDSPGYSSEFEAQVHDMAQNPHDYIDYNLSNTSSSYEEMEYDDDNNNHGSSGRMKRKKEKKFKRTKLRMEEKVYLYAMVTLLLFITYLLLVYLPSGLMPSLLGSFLVSCVILKPQICDEIRRKRFDRLSAIWTLILFAASFLSLATYAKIGINEGTIYVGPARIVGYDTTVYEVSSGGTVRNKKTNSIVDTQATRMDLEVAWGGQWGCPDYDGVQCQAFVSGALCEVDENIRKLNRTSSSRNKRYLDGATNDNDEIVTVEELEKEVEELKEENEELKEQNTALDTDAIMEDEELNVLADAALNYYVKAADEEEKAEYYKDVAVDEAEINVEEAAEVLEGLVDTDYYADVADEEAEVIEETLGEEGEEIVEEIEEEVLDEYDGVSETVEDVAQENIDEIEEASNSVESTSIDPIEDQVNEAIDEEIDTFYDAEDEISDEGDVIVDVHQKENEIDGDEAEEFIEEEEEETEDVIEEIHEEEDEGVISVEEGGEIIEDAEEEEEIVIEEEYGASHLDDDEGCYNENNSYTYNGYHHNGKYIYSFDDDNFQDDWWGREWSDVWGEYACNDIFDTDLEGKSFDSDEMPGSDEWPFVNIYGSCNKCEAYLIDYYSTEHFNAIKLYQVHAWNYALVGVLGLILTSIFVIKQHVSPAEENELGLLMNEGGQESRMVV